MKKHLQALINIVLFLGLAQSGFSQLFQEIIGTSNVEHYYAERAKMGGGVVFFDYNNDGYDDMFLTGGYNPDMLYRNNQDGTFTDVTLEAGLENTYQLFTVGAISGDMDNDGDRDLFVYTWVNTDDETQLGRNLFYENNGDGTFTEKGIQAGFLEGTFTMGASLIDYNLDGYLDVYFGNYIKSGSVLDGTIECFPNLFYENNGDGTFTEMASELGIDNEGCTLAVKSMDYDQDELADIYLANDFGEFDFTIRNVLFKNNTRTFADVTVQEQADVGFYAMGIANGDYDLDGDLDVYITNLGKNALLQKNADGFSRVEDAARVGNQFALDPPGNTSTTGWGTAFMDYNNDLWPDLFVANGRVPTQPDTVVPYTGEMDPNKLYENNKDGTFKDISIEAGVDDIGRGRGMAFSDFDLDGDLDVFVVNQNADGLTGPFSSKFYKNELNNSNKWIQFTLEGTENNADGFGALIKLYVNDLVLLRENSTCGSHTSQHGTKVHFGLGNYEQADSVKVIWPGGGIQTHINGEIDLSGGSITHIKESVDIPTRFAKFTTTDNHDEILLSWETVFEPGNKGFNIQRTIDPSNGFENIGWVEAQGPGDYTFTDNTVVNDQLYFYRIEQVDFDSDITLTDVVQEALLSSTGFDLNGKESAGTILLDWKTAAEPQLNRFEIQRSVDADQNFSTIGTSVPDGSGAYAFTDATANPGQLYYYRIRAIQEDNDEAFSEVINAAIVVPDNYIFKAIPSEIDIELTWKTDFEIAISSFTLERALDESGPFSSIGTVIPSGSANSYSFKDDSAEPLKIYFYRLKQENESGEANYSNTDGAVIITPESVQLSLESENIGVQVNWNIAIEFKVNSFEVERSVNPQTDFTSLGLINANGSGSYIYTDQAIPENGIYYYRIKQNSENGVVVYSTVQQIDILLYSAELTVAENPVSNTLIITAQNMDDFSNFYIFNSLGKQMGLFTNPIGSNRVELDITTLPAGAYFLQAIGSDKRTVLKFIKSN